MSDPVRLSDLSMRDLKRLAQRLEREVTSRQLGSTKAMRRQIHALLRAAGFEWDEVLGVPASDEPITRPRKPMGSVAPKYRNPYNQQQTWTGRGSQPAWVKAHVSTGRSLDALLINK